MSLGSNIRKKRKSLKLSQEYVAEQLEVSRQAVSKWGMGQSEPSTNNLLKLADMFSCDVQEIITLEKSVEESISINRQTEQRPITFKDYRFSYTHLILTMMLFSTSFLSAENPVLVTLLFLFIVNMSCFSSEYLVLKYYRMNPDKKFNQGYAVFIMIHVFVTVFIFLVVKWLF